MSIVPQLLDVVSRLDDSALQIALTVEVARGPSGLDVRRFELREELSTPFRIELEVVSPHHDLDLGTIVGKEAAFAISHNLGGHRAARRWSGICTRASLMKTTSVVAESPPPALFPREHGDLSTYRLTIEPALARLGYRTDHAIFQGATIPEIVGRVLARWEIEPTLEIAPSYPVLEYCVQYGETDLAFVSRLLEEAGITYRFDHDGGETKLVLCDEPHRNAPRSPLRFNPETSARADVSGDILSGVQIFEEMRPTRVALRGSDFLVKADDRLDGIATADGVDELGVYETYAYDPHAFRFFDLATRGSEKLGEPGSRATREGGERSARLRLAATRRGSRSLSARSNSIDLAPGTVFAIHEHPRADLATTTSIVTAAHVAGDGHQLDVSIRAVFTDAPLVPERRTPKPRARMQSAIVTGPEGEEIHVDVHGRVKIQFHWDREGMFDDASSCWVRVSNAVAGSAQGMVAHPRVGQEVLVDFCESDPDQPVVVGRVYNVVNPPPYSLPEHKAWSGIKTDTYPRSDGFNQLMFVDDKGAECILEQAQRDRVSCIKRNQSTQVGAMRTSHVGAADSLVVGVVQTTEIGVQSIVRVGEEQEVHVGRQRTSVIGERDLVRAGESFTVVTGEGTGVQINGRDGYIALTNGMASIVLDGPNIYLDAKNGIQLTGEKLVRADAVGGQVEINCGKSGGFGKPVGDGVAVCTLPGAVPPDAPGEPTLGGGTSVAPYRHRPSVQTILPPSPYLRIGDDVAIGIGHDHDHAPMLDAVATGAQQRVTGASAPLAAPASAPSAGELAGWKALGQTRESALATAEKARAEAKKMLEKSVTSLERWNAKDQADFKTWFGGVGELDRQRMLVRAKGALGRVGALDFAPGRVSSTVIAEVFPQAGNNLVFLGNKFFDLPLTGVDSQGGTLIHELSHLDIPEGSLPDLAYGVGTGRALARKNPRAAQLNADNFGFWAATVGGR